MQYTSSFRSMATQMVNHFTINTFMSFRSRTGAFIRVAGFNVYCWYETQTFATSALSLNYALIWPYKWFQHCNLQSRFFSHVAPKVSITKGFQMDPEDKRVNDWPISKLTTTWTTKLMNSSSFHGIPVASAVKTCVFTWAIGLSCSAVFTCLFNRNKASCSFCQLCKSSHLSSSSPPSVS